MEGAIARPVVTLTVHTLLQVLQIELNLLESAGSAEGTVHMQAIFIVRLYYLLGRKQIELRVVNDEDAWSATTSALRFFFVFKFDFNCTLFTVLVVLALGHFGATVCRFIGGRW